MMAAAALPASAGRTPAEGELASRQIGAWMVAFAKLRLSGLSILTGLACAVQSEGGSSYSTKSRLASMPTSDACNWNIPSFLVVYLSICPRVGCLGFLIGTA